VSGQELFTVVVAQKRGSGSEGKVGGNANAVAVERIVATTIREILLQPGTDLESEIRRNCQIALVKEAMEIASK